MMVEDMNTDPKRDEKLLAHFKNRLQANYERWKQANPGRTPTNEWYGFTKGAVFSTLGVSFIVTGLFAFAAEFCTFGSIYLIRYLALYIAKPESDINEAALLMALFTVATFTASILRNFYIYYGYSMALEMRKVLVSAIFDKVSRISMRSLTETNSGKLITLISSDIF